MASSPASASISRFARLTSAFTAALPDGLQSIARRQQLAALRPAADHDEDARDVAAEEVAVDRAEVRLAGLGDAAIRLVDGLARPAQELEQEREVGARAHRLVDEPGGRRPGERLAEERLGGLGLVAAAARDRERRQRVDRLGLRLVADRGGDVERLAGDLLRVAERGGDHPLLGEQREDAGPLDGRLLGHHVGGLAQRRGRARPVARREPVAAEPRLEDGVLETVPPLPEGREAALRVDRRAAGAAGRGRRLGRQLRDGGQPDAVRRPVRRLAVRPGHGRRQRQLQPELERVERVQRRLELERQPAGLERRGPRLGGAVRGPPVVRGDDRDVAERRRERRPVARPLRWQQVRDDGPRDELVADPEAAVVLLADEPVLDRLGEAGREVGIQPVGGAARHRRGSRREVGGDLAVASSASNAAETMASRSRSIGRCDGASSRSTRRHSWDRRASRAAMRSPSVPVRLTCLSSRRAAISSSITSGVPADRSATRTTTEAEGRSPSIPSIWLPISRRVSGARSTRTGARSPASITARFARNGCSRVSRSGCQVSTSDSRSSRAIRDTNVANARVAASATWRSSSATTIGRSAATRPSQRMRASSARGWRRSGVGQGARPWGGHARRRGRRGAAGRAAAAARRAGGAPGARRRDARRGADPARPARTSTAGPRGRSRDRAGSAAAPGAPLPVPGPGPGTGSHPCPRCPRRGRSSQPPSRRPRWRRRPARCPAHGR